MCSAPPYQQHWTYLNSIPTTWVCTRWSTAWGDGQQRVLHGSLPGGRDMLGGPLSAADLSSKLVQRRPGQTEGAPLVLLHERFRAANGVLFNCLSQLVHPENAIRNISLLEIVIPVLRPHRVTLANDLEIVVCKDERIDRSVSTTLRQVA